MALVDVRIMRFASAVCTHTSCKTYCGISTQTKVVSARDLCKGPSRMKRRANVRVVA